MLEDDEELVNGAATLAYHRDNVPVAEHLTLQLDLDHSARMLARLIAYGHPIADHAVEADLQLAMAPYLIALIGESDRVLRLRLADHTFAWAASDKAVLEVGFYVVERLMQNFTADMPGAAYPHDLFAGDNFRACARRFCGFAGVEKTTSHGERDGE